MGASSRQLELMDLHAWFVRPSTGRTVYGAAPSSSVTPSSGRLTGPYAARLTSMRSPHWGPDNADSSPAGDLIVASTVAPSTMTVAAVVSATTVASAGRTYAAAGVRVFYDDVGVHHVTMTLGRLT